MEQPVCKNFCQLPYICDSARLAQACDVVIRNQLPLEVSPPLPKIPEGREWTHSAQQERHASFPAQPLGAFPEC